MVGLANLTEGSVFTVVHCSYSCSSSWQVEGMSEQAEKKNGSGKIQNNSNPVQKELEDINNEVIQIMFRKMRGNE